MNPRHVVVVVLASTGIAVPQAPHPFAPPIAVPQVAIARSVGVGDVNRDGAPDAYVVNHLGLGTTFSTLDEHGAAPAANCFGRNHSARRRDRDRPTAPPSEAATEGARSGDRRTGTA